MRGVATRVAAVIRVDAIWLATEPLDMRAGTETALARGGGGVRRCSPAPRLLLRKPARLNGHDPYAYLKDVLTRLPTQKKARSLSCCRIGGAGQVGGTVNSVCGARLPCALDQGKKCGVKVTPRLGGVRM